MTGTQLYLAIGVPVVSNAIMLLLFSTMINARFASFETEIHRRLDEMRADLQALTGKVVDIDNRLTRIEERLEHRSDSSSNRSGGRAVHDGRSRRSVSQCRSGRHGSC